MRLRAVAVVLFATLSPCLAGGNWIAVVAPALQDAIKPLVERHQAEGWQVTVIIAEENPAAAMQSIAALAADGGPCCVLLAGDFFPEAGANRVPPGTGIHLRMKDKMTDLPWSAGGKKGNIEVGRLPARNPGEAGVMVRKILAWPADEAHRKTFPRAELVVGHHGAPPALDAMANSVINSLTLRLVGQLAPAWRFDGAAHIDGSPWQVSPESLTATSARMMTTRATFLAYMGHSAVNGAVSKNTLLLSDAAWYALPAEGPRPGLFFTCGCHSCELTHRLESFGFAAMRSPGGPPAVIGSTGETWSAMGYLAASGLIDRLAGNPAPVRLGTLWLGVQQGLARGKINAATFAILDRADGTDGKIPLDQQRLEHLESWMLLGDPAMPLLPPPSVIQINPPPAPVQGQPFVVTGTLPAGLAGAGVHVTLERHPSAVRRALPGKDNEPALTVMEIGIAASDVTATGTTFSASMDLPSPLPAKPWTLRVETTKPSAAGGVLQIK
ncbi:MAG: C25 family cysteine peptidase [Luteolibacter sp.]|uniref:C25 family cysteine peptidase n=1 Tax=Luteolibacter sp. TaxID=1962973 RepID=UPI003266E18D